MWQCGWGWHIYIYIYTLESKTGPMFAFFLRQKLVKFSIFLILLLKILLSARRMRFFKTKKEVDHFLSRLLVQLCCATYLDQFLTQPWSNFDSRGLTFLHMFGCYKIGRNHYFYNVFQQKCIFKLTPRNRNTISNTTALIEIKLSLLSAFLFWGYFCHVRFFAIFSRGMRKQNIKNKHSKQNIKERNTTTRCKQ